MKANFVSLFILSFISINTFSHASTSYTIADSIELADSSLYRDCGYSCTFEVDGQKEQTSYELSEVSELNEHRYGFGGDGKTQKDLEKYVEGFNQKLKQLAGHGIVFSYNISSDKWFVVDEKRFIPARWCELVVVNHLKMTYTSHVFYPNHEEQKRNIFNSDASFYLRAYGKILSILNGLPTQSDLLIENLELFPDGLHTIEALKKELDDLQHSNAPSLCTLEKGMVLSAALKQLMHSFGLKTSAELEAEKREEYFKDLVLLLQILMEQREEEHKEAEKQKEIKKKKEEQEERERRERQERQTYFVQYE